MIAILDTVRNTILDFILILKDEIPGLSDFTFSSETNESQQEKAERIISTKIDKLIGNISIGSENVTQEIYQKVPINNLDALINELSKLGVSDQDLDKLADAINKDGKLKNNAFGKQVNSWCTKTLKLAGKGLLKGGVSIASEILFSLIKSYYGII